MKASSGLVSVLKNESSTKKSSSSSPISRATLGVQLHEGKGTSQQQPKRVTFSKAGVHIRTIIGRHELSDGELEAAWYHKEEYRSIARGCRELARQWSRGKSIECSRGLEWLTRDRKTQTREMRQSSWDVVLNEQDKQMLNGSPDWDYIALVYRLASSRCQCWSIKVGLEDQRESKRYRYDDRSDPSTPYLTWPECVKPETKNVGTRMVPAQTPDQDSIVRDETKQVELSLPPSNHSVEKYSSSTFDGARAA